VKSKTIKTYDWIEDVGPELLKNLNELLDAKGIEPLSDLHGGSFKDGKWVGYDVPDTNDYRNYWHAYLEAWGERMYNDSYQLVRFSDPDDDQEWEWYIDHLRTWATSQYRNYEHADPNWTDDLVTAMRRVVKEHFDDYEDVVFWWCW
jgi:hypothetical protein